MGQIAQVGNLVVGDVEDAKRRVGFQAGDLREGIVRNVEFLEGREVGEVGDLGEAVGLEGKDFEVRKGGEILGQLLGMDEGVKKGTQMCLP